MEYPGNHSVVSAENGETFSCAESGQPKTHELLFSYLDLAIWEENARRMTTSKVITFQSSSYMSHNYLHMFYLLSGSLIQPI
jgi:hypothetical protein